MTRENSYGPFQEVCRQRIQQYRSNPFHHSVAHITGWLSPTEEQLLYNIARTTDGPFLEIGPWVGRSTACIAYGIKDGNAEKDFTTIELNPSEENFRPTLSRQIDDKAYLFPRKGMGFFCPKDSRKPIYVSDINRHNRDIVPQLNAPGGIVGLLESNLSRLGLLDLVTIREGDFREIVQPKRYGFIFCDCTHNVHEISQNLPVIKRLASSGSIIALHDIKPKLVRHVRKHIPVRYYSLIDLLYIGFM